MDSTMTRQNRDTPLTELEKWAIIKIAEMTGKAISQVRQQYLELPLLES